MALVLLAFLSGLATILAPCIWPVLPIIFSSSVYAKSTRNLTAVISGIIISFSFEILLLSSLTRIFHFDSNILRDAAALILVLLGISMIFPPLQEQLERLLSRITLPGSRVKGASQKTGVIPSFITGLSLGILWTPCAGPILAAVIALSATQTISGAVFTVGISYVIGMAIPLFIVGKLGIYMKNKLHFISKHSVAIQRVFGIIIILFAITIYTNAISTLQANLENRFPALAGFVNIIDNTGAAKNALAGLTGKNSGTNNNALFNADTSAPDFTGITKWLNTDKPVTLASLKGQVVLVDFWTYSCINCIRSLPHVIQWYDRYHSSGFTVIGIETPEFDFEKNSGNVEEAIKSFNIPYAVGQDNNYGTWNAYNNEYWPAEYLINQKGTIVREDFGEGEYDQMEEAIRSLLMTEGKKLQTYTSSAANQTPTTALSPETYFGSDRMEYYDPDGSIPAGNSKFTLDSNPPLNSFSLGGLWNIGGEYATPTEGATLTYTFNASKVYMVINPPADKSVIMRVELDGHTIPSSLAGSDVTNGIVTITTDRLYNLVNLGNNPGEHLLKLTFLNPNTNIFTFTFG